LYVKNEIRKGKISSHHIETNFFFSQHVLLCNLLNNSISILINMIKFDNCCNKIDVNVVLQWLRFMRSLSFYFLVRGARVNQQSLIISSILKIQDMHYIQVNHIIFIPVYILHSLSFSVSCKVHKTLSFVVFHFKIWYIFS